MRCVHPIDCNISIRNPKHRKSMSPRRARWGARAALVPAAALSAVSILGLCSNVSAQAITWIGGTTGDWGTGTNWSGGVAPNSGSVTALVDANNPQNTSVTISGNYTVGTLMISAGDQVTLGNNLSLAIATLLGNSGTFVLAPVGNNSTLSTAGGSMAIAGGGVIHMQGGNSVLAGGGTMTNMDNLIHGQGAIGNNNTFFINQGTVNADVNGSSIFFDPVATGMLNSGTLTSSNGATLRFNGQFGGGLTSTGTISAQNGSVTQFENSFGVTGGTFTTSGTGVVRSAAGHLVYYDSINNLGNWSFENNSTSNYSGNLFNSGSLNLNAAGNNVILAFNAGTTNLTGAGTINMGTTGAGAAIIGNGNGRLVNVNNTIRGSGAIGNNNQAFTNGALGIVSADVSGAALFVDPVSAADSFVNNGLMRAVGGGLLQFSGQFGGAVTNTGTLLADGAGSEIQLYNSIGIAGGTFTTANGGVVRVAAGQLVYLASIGNLGNLTLDSNSTTNVGGDLFNSGSINLSAVGNNVLIAFNGGTNNLTGGGAINMGTTGTGVAIIGNGDGRLVNVNNTIRGSGNLGNNSQRFINGALGVVSADVNGVGLFVDPIAEADGFVNNGLMRATGGGVLQFSGQFGGGVNNTNGTITALTGSEVQFYNSSFVLGGTISSVGTGVIRVAAGQGVDFQNNTFAGNVVVDNNATLRVGPGTLTNTGSINLNAVGNNANLNLSGGSTVTLTGGGAINLGTTGAGAAIIGGGGTLVNLNNTIRGAGNIANNAISFVNAGTISADKPGEAIYIDPVSVGTLDFNNTGTMQATNGGILQLTGAYGGQFNNTGGRIIVQTGSGAQLFNSVGITGGTFSSLGTGTVSVPPGNTAYVANVASTAAFVVENNSTLYAGGTFENNKSITISTAANNSHFNASGNLAISGTGTIYLTDSNAGGRAIFGASSGTIALGAGQTVQGFGNIASNNTAIISNGLINADTNAKTIFIDPISATDGFVNNNLMTATNGGVLQFTGQFGGGVTNNGTISAGTASLVQLFSGIGISGGTFTSSGTGAVEVLASHSASTSNIKQTGMFNINNNSTLNAVGTLDNTGTITLNPAANNSHLNSSGGTLLLSGGGTILMNAGTSGSAIIGASGNTIDLDQVVRGRGNIGANNAAIINRRSITAAGGGEIFVDPVSAVDGFRNLGVLRAENGSQLQLNGQFGGGINNTGGHIDIDAGGVLLTNSSHSLSGGTMTLDGVWNATNSSNSDLVFFRGSGVLNVNNSARVGVMANGTSAATSRLSGITTAASGKLDVTDNDLVVDYTGATPVDSIRQQIGSAYGNGSWNGATGITSSAAAAAAGSTNKTGLGYLDNVSGAIAVFSGQPVDNTSVLVKYTYFGDSNLDGQVDITDLGNLATNWQTAGLWPQGDFNYSGFIDITDLGALATNWQAGVGSPLGPSFDEALAALGLPGASVPEPSGAAVVALILPGLMRRRRTR